MKWLKQLFKKTELEEYNIPIDQLFDWFLEQSEPMLADIKQTLRRRLVAITEEVATIRDKLVLVNEAQLRNENIPEKARKIMEANRQNYVRHVQEFLSGLDVPEQPHFDDVNAFISRFEERLSAVTKSTAKSFYVLKEFFANEVGQVAKHINNLDLSVRELHVPDYKKIMVLKKKIITLENLLKNKQTVHGAFEERKHSSHVLLQLIENIQENIAELKQSKSYRALETLHEQKDKLKTKLKHNENVLAGEFSAFSRALKKYGHISLDGKTVIDAYLLHPFKALLADPNFRILQVLQQMKQQMHSDQILLKPREKDRAMEKVNSITQQHLETLLDIDRKIKEQIRGIEKRMMLNNVQREIEELEYKLKHLQDKHGRAEKTISKMEKTTTKIDVEGLQEELEDGINNLIDLPINIVVEERKEGKEESDAPRPPPEFQV